jgi:hypothetical protein
MTVTATHVSGCVLAREFANNPCFPPLIPPREGLLLLPFYEYGQDKSRSWATTSLISDPDIPV